MSDENQYEQLRLENEPCFALYAATRVVIKTCRERLDPMGLTYPQYLVLTVLWENNGLTISELGRTLMLDSGTLTPLVKRLEAMNLTTRQRRSKDEREVEVWLTPKGFDIRDLAIGVPNHVLRRLGMTLNEIATLRAELMTLITHATRTEHADEPLIGYRFASPAAATASDWNPKASPTRTEHADEPLIGYRFASPAAATASDWNPKASPTR